MDKLITAFLALIGLFAFLFYYTTSYTGYNTETLVYHSGEMEVFIFDTPYELKIGLSGREGLKENQGALFFFYEPGLYEFVTLDMRMAVDMIWLDENMNVVDITENVPPCLSDIERRCPSYTPSEPVLYVIEANGGFSNEHDIKKGDHFELGS